MIKRINRKRIIRGKRRVKEMFTVSEMVRKTMDVYRRNV